MRATLANAKNFSLMKSLGVATCSPEFVSLVNDAQQRLADAGRWWGLYERIRLCITDGCITWPQEVAAVEAFRTCNQAMPVRNMWWEFQETVPAPVINDAQYDNGPLYGPWSKPMLLERTNTLQVCQSRDWSGALPIKIYPTVSSDAGQRVLLQGVDQNGIPIRTYDMANNVYVDGYYVTLATPFVQTPFPFLGPRLTGVQKPTLNGSLNVYVVNADLSETQIAVWQPNETNPSYRRSYIYKRPKSCGSSQNTCGNNGDGCDPALANCTGPVADAIIRREFLPVVGDADWLLIGNLQALYYGMKSVQYGEDSDEKREQFNWQKALEMLRNELKKYGPRNQTTFEVQVLPKCDRGRYAGFW
jgi:hypothetical protein